MNTRNLILIGLAFLGLTGCTSQVGPDSNVEVFETPEKASAARKQKLLLDWQEMTLRFANAERPDIKTIKAPGFAVQMSADGVDRTVDLTPLSEKLSAAMGKEREPIRAFLAQEFPKVDRARLKAIGFERAKAMLHPSLANTRQTAEMTAADTKQPPIANPVVIDLNWVPVVRWPGTEGQTAVDADLAGAWKVTPAEVGAAALANLRAELAARSEPLFDTVDLPGLGRYGSLRSGVDTAVLILPEFLATVRKAWQSTDDLVISFPSKLTVSFLERKNEKLLNTMLPQWNGRYAQVSVPMISTMLLASDVGLNLFSYSPPTTKPATKPTTKRVYITH